MSVPENFKSFMQASDVMQASNVCKFLFFMKYSLTAKAVEGQKVKISWVMRFPSRYVRPEKPQISLRICTV